MGPAEDLILISALEHWSYCARQCSLIHLEQTFTENVYTVRGRHAHERVHSESAETVGDIRVVRGLPLWSDELGLVGKADAVEFRGGQAYPVEYKVGKPARWGHEDIQLAAQAMCLEEMLGQGVPRGAVFYRGSQQRREVLIDSDLRSSVRDAARGVRLMLRSETLPPPVDDARCPRCSLFDACLPNVVDRSRRIKLLRAALFKPDDQTARATPTGEA